MVTEAEHLEADLRCAIARMETQLGALIRDGRGCTLPAHALRRKIEQLRAMLPCA